MSSPKWTVLFIIHAVDEETRVYSEKLFSDLLQTRSSPDVRIFVLHNTYNYKSNMEDIDATLYEIKYDDGDKRKYKKRLSDPAPLVRNEINLGGVDELSEILKVVRETSEDGKLILITWDHGCGFGIFDIEEKDDVNFSNDNRLQRNGHKTDMLMVGELGKALKKVFITENKEKHNREKTIDLLIMMNCWMQSIETATELTETVDILIAPETTIDFLGYDYISLVDLISGPNPPDTEDLAKEVIQTTVKKYENSKTDITANKLIISATRPMKSKLIVDEIRKLAPQLREAVKDEKGDQIIAKRKMTEELTSEFIGTPWYFVDLLDVVTKLDGLCDPKGEITKKLEDILDENSSYYDYMVKKYVGADFKGEGKNYGGISICFPYQDDDFINGDFYTNFYSLGAKRPISFPAQVGDWPAFIRDLIAKEAEATTPIAKGIRKEEEDTGENFLLDLEILINVDSSSRIRVDSLVAGCTKLDDKGRIQMVKVRSGAGDPKRQGAGDPKRQGAALAKLRGAGDPKNHGAGQLILTTNDLLDHNGQQQEET